MKKRSLQSGGPIRAAILADGNPRDIGLWSGIPCHMLAALAPHLDLVLVVETPWASWFRPVGRALKALSGRRFQYTASGRFTGAAAAGTIARLRQASPDVVLAISVSPLAHLLVNEFRVVNIADATTRQLIGYYASATRSVGHGAAGADAIEAKLIDGALLSLYPSHWARNSAIRDYGASPDLALEIAWGSNIADTEAAPREPPHGPVRLLFVGGEWERKGGPLAVATVAALRARGIDCRLDIVGADAAIMSGEPVPAGVVFHGFVAKADPVQAAMLAALFRDATFFLLPTKAECFGIVFAEAASRGLPSISIATGGVTSAVRHGLTGQLLPPQATADDFAAAIAAIIATPGRYAAMSRAALDDARERLNWDIWAAAAAAAIRAALARAAKPAAVGPRGPAVPKAARERRDDDDD